MPIFAYRCSHCGFGKDVLQKRTDAPLVVCPECQQETFSKQLTAPAFQLKGSGWYVTDFRDNGAKGKPSGSEAAGDSSGSAGAPTTAVASPAPAPAAAPAPASTPAPAAAAPAAAGNGS